MALLSSIPARKSVAHCCAALVVLLLLVRCGLAVAQDQASNTKLLELRDAGVALAKKPCPHGPTIRTEAVKN
jgi:hypothetical protein